MYGSAGSRSGSITLGPAFYCDADPGFPDKGLQVKKTPKFALLLKIDRAR